MVFEFKRFVAFRAFELPENGTFVVADHVPLKSVHVGESFVAHFARLKQKPVHSYNTTH